MKSLFVTTWIYLMLAFSMPTKAFCQDQMRHWSSRNGDETVEARFQSFNPKSKTISIQLRDGRTLQVGLKQLSRADRRYVSNRHRDRTDKFDNLPAAGAANENRIDDKGRKGGKYRKSSKPVRAFGINWIPGIQSALQHAFAGESSQDDRPVMWMRVLGDLEGFM